MMREVTHVILTVKTKNTRRAAAIALAAGLLFPAGGSIALLAQQPPQNPPQNPPPLQGPIRVDVSLVNLFATVRDRSRRLVPGLPQDTFQIFEDGKEQKIDFFRAETDLPITLGLLMDTSGSMYSVFGAEQDAASRFLHRVLKPQKDLAMILTFDTDVDLMADLTGDTDKLERAIRRARVHVPAGRVTPGTVPGGSGGTNLYDAVWLACREKLARESGRKAIILLTDAYDTGSKVDLKEALEAAQRTDTVVHVLYIDPGGGFGLRGGGDPGVAKRLAEETGGRMIEIRSDRDFERAFDEIAQELRSQYTLGYYPTNPNRDGAFRKVKVEAKGKDLRILTRKGYYAPKG